MPTLTDTPKKKFRPFGVRKRVSMGATVMAAVAVIVWLQGFAPLCKHLPVGFWRDLCLAFTSSHARAEGMDGGVEIELESVRIEAAGGGAQ